MYDFKESLDQWVSTTRNDSAVFPEEEEDNELDMQEMYLNTTHFHIDLKK
jgi:hypothetical protein